MPKERPALGLEKEPDTISIEELGGKSRAKKQAIPPKIVQEVAEQSGFPSREGKKRRRRRKKSPYTAQLGLKVRPAMKELFQELGEYLDVYDHTTFERALLALLEKEGTPAHRKTYQNVISK